MIMRNEAPKDAKLILLMLLYLQSVHDPLEKQIPNGIEQNTIFFNINGYLKNITNYTFIKKIKQQNAKPVYKIEKYSVYLHAP